MNSSPLKVFKAAIFRKNHDFYIVSPSIIRIFLYLFLCFFFAAAFSTASKGNELMYGLLLCNALVHLLYYILKETLPWWDRWVSPRVSEKVFGPLMRLKNFCVTVFMLSGALVSVLLVFSSNIEAITSLRAYFIVVLGVLLVFLLALTSLSVRILFTQWLHLWSQWLFNQAWFWMVLYWVWLILVLVINLDVALSCILAYNLYRVVATLPATLSGALGIFLILHPLGVGSASETSILQMAGWQEAFIAQCTKLGFKAGKEAFFNLPQPTQKVIVYVYVGAGMGVAGLKCYSIYEHRMLAIVEGKYRAEVVRSLAIQDAMNQAKLQNTAIMSGLEQARRYGEDADAHGKKADKAEADWRKLEDSLNRLLFGRPSSVETRFQGVLQKLKETAARARNLEGTYRRLEEEAAAHVRDLAHARYSGDSLYLPPASTEPPTLGGDARHASSYSSYSSYSLSDAFSDLP